MITFKAAILLIEKGTITSKGLFAKGYISKAMAIKLVDEEEGVSDRYRRDQKTLIASCEG